MIGISHVMIFSRQHAEAVQWYCDKLGYEINFNAPGEYASLRHKALGGLGIHGTSDISLIGKGPVLYFLCEDIQKTVSELRSKDIKVTEPKSEAGSPFFCDFYDLEGNVWGLQEKMRH